MLCSQSRHSLVIFLKSSGTTVCTTTLAHTSFGNRYLVKFVRNFNIHLGPFNTQKHCFELHSQTAFQKVIFIHSRISFITHSYFHSSLWLQLMSGFKMWSPGSAALSLLGDYEKCRIYDSSLLH